MLRHKGESSKQCLAELMREDPPVLYTRHADDYMSIGKGLFTNKAIKKEEYIGEYKGRLMTCEEVEGLDSETYLYVFKHNEKLHGIGSIWNMPVMNGRIPVPGWRRSLYMAGLISFSRQ